MFRYWLFICWFIGFVQTKAQHTRDVGSISKKIVKINPLSPIIGVINVHLEKQLHASDSYQAELFYFTGQVFNQQSDVRGVGVTFNYRFYITEEFPKGWYIQPFVRYQRYWPIGRGTNNSTRSSSSVNNNLQVGGIGAVLGYQTLIVNGISFEIYAGPVYSKMFTSDSQPKNTVSILNGPWLRAGITFGFLF
jgi:hypothetical protein